MTDEQPKAAPETRLPQKNLSGFLIFSIFLSFGGFFFLPVLGPVIGLVLGIVGRKKTLVDSMLIGPRFAALCIGLAVVCIPFQSWILYQRLPSIAFGQDVGEVQSAFFENLKDRNYDRIYELMSASYRKSATEEELGEMLAAAFTGDDAIDVESNYEIRADEIDEEAEQKRFQDFFAESKGFLDFDLPYRITHEGEKVDLTLKIGVTRDGYMDFKSELVDITAVRIEPVEEPEKKPEEKSEEKSEESDD